MPSQYDDRDPIGSLRRGVAELNEFYQNERDLRELEALNREENQRVEAQRRTTHAWARDQVQRYSRDNPEYSEAFEWLISREGEILSNAGLSPPEVNQALNVRADQLFSYAKSKNLNPAALVFSTATSYGYQPTGKWIGYLDDNEFDELWGKMQERDRQEQYYGSGEPRRVSREGIPISTPEEEAGGLEDWLWKRAGSGKRR